MTKPTQLDPLAEAILRRLTGKPEAAEIVLGGYFVLQHYLGYRKTHDIDAWWKSRANLATEKVIREAMWEVAREHGLELRERRFGETVSFELLSGGRRRFAFQIAVRSIALEEPSPSAWPPVLIETLSDNIGSKMNALVDRGSPRDFTDIHQVVESGLVLAERCWELWAAKNPQASLDAAKQKVLLHLAGLEARRPVSSIKDSAERIRAASVRQWYKEVFTKK